MRCGGHQDRLHVQRQLHAQIVERAHLQRIAGRHHRGVTLALDHQQPVLLGEADRDRRRQIDVDVVDLDVGAVRDPHLQPERLQQVLLGDGAHLDQDLAQPPALLRLRRQGLLDRFGRERRHGRRRLRLQGEQQFTETLLGHRGDLLTAEAPPGVAPPAAGPGAGAERRPAAAAPPLRSDGKIDRSRLVLLLAQRGSRSARPPPISTSRATRLISSSMPTFLR